MFTVLFYGQPYETAQIHENMAENPKAESSPPQVGTLLCQSFCWRQRSLAVAQDIPLQRRRSQAHGISQRTSRACRQRQRRSLGENDIRRGAKNPSAEPSRRCDNQTGNAALLEPDF